MPVIEEVTSNSSSRVITSNSSDRVVTNNSSGRVVKSRSKFVNELIITEKKTKHGRAFSFFRNMESHNVIRPRRSLHAWQTNTFIARPVFSDKTPVFHIDDHEHREFKSSDSKPTSPCQKKVKSVFKKLWNSFDNYCDKSTLHGLRYVGDNTLSVTERLFWFLSFATAVCFAFYFITNLYTKYNKSPVIVSFSPALVTLNTIPFPAITICNVNIAMKDVAEQIMTHGSEVNKRLLSDMCNLNTTSFANDSDNELIGDWPTVRKFVISINQKCDDMFKLCKWESTAVDCSQYINSILTDEGYCCSFNRLASNYSLKEASDELNETYPFKSIDWNPEDGYPEGVSDKTIPMRSFGAGEHLGLTVVMDANLEQYYCTSTASIGFKVLLSNPIESPKVADFGFLISPGDEYRITISPSIKDATEGVRGIEVSKRQCFFAHERNLQFYRLYTERNCKMECQANHTLEVCQCVPYYLPKNGSSKICDKRSEPCLVAAKLETDKFTINRTKCGCLPACHEVSYSLESLTTGRISRKYNITLSDEMRQGYTHEYFSENMVVARFFFSKDKFTKQTKSELYGFSEFLSNTGGLLGLFLGFSFLSGVEILYFIVLRTGCNIYRSEKRKRKQEALRVMAKTSVSLPFMK